MKRPLNSLCVLLIGLTCLASGAGRAAQGDWAALRANDIVLLRHALAPGTGDPPGFKLNDCRTQRNLDDTGRDQARRIGEQFRAQGVRVARVLTSQWCRTRETAQLAFPGLPQDEPAFNSFFDNRSSEAAQTRAALSILTRWTGPGLLVVVTHQVNITALTRIVPDSGEGVIVRPQNNALEVVGRLRFN